MRYAACAVGRMQILALVAVLPVVEAAPFEDLLRGAFSVLIFPRPVCAD